MPAVSGKAGKDVKAAYMVHVGKMTGPKTKVALAKVLSMGMTNAKEYAPLEYGTLINSAYRRIEGKGDQWRGVGGFAADYSVYLNGTAKYTPLWKPVAPENKEGPAWNPFAKARFLDLGFIGPLSKGPIQQIIRESYQ